MPRNDVTAFAEAMEKLINHYVSEFNLTYTEVTGVLEIQKHILLMDNYVLLESDDEIPC